MDVAIDKAGQCVGFGMVIPDSEGFIMIASSQKVTSTYSPQIAEAVAIQQGIQMACDSSLHPLMLESNANVGMIFL
ncbi:hypothetical protein EZV62_010838 [Acer yangbiense]|uniref:RNase H type-1 domain-containing protein n=1 Tax=Acer yangbiense TaxID=1000413 RepID=A0A5C7I433_9ROSI|nr:hypothetical protein EZV62_010838 [Acer yangbiense]